MSANSFAISTTDPDQFQQFMLPLVGENRVRPGRGTRFEIDVQAFQFGRTHAFTVKSPSLLVEQEPLQPQLAINIPLGSHFSVGPAEHAELYEKDVHILRPEDAFHFLAPRDCRSMTIGIAPEAASDYAKQMGLEAASAETPADRRLPWRKQATQNLLHSVARSWSLLQSGGKPALESLHIVELEDELVCEMTLTTLAARAGSHGDPGAAAVDRAEQYLCAHLDRAISRAEMAEAAATSIRSLSRGFRKRWGMGPMQFLRERRLDAVYMLLLGAHGGEVTVSEVAHRFGFTQLGTFAGQYRKAFGELPSETLAK